ncbi:MAG: HNH endonuclease [Actinomycetota bacterium]|nr:HNH endonuclease [Actinomycetota bacterium]
MGDKTGIEWTDATWNPVSTWPGVHASPDGRVRGPSGKQLEPYVSRTGHRYFLIRRKKLWLHHAVLLAFVGPRPEGGIGRHLNDDPADNRVENLAWGTLSDNAQDALRNGGRATGPASTSPLAVEDVQLIRQSPASSRELALYLGVSHTTVQKIRRNERWQHDGR